MDRTNGTADTSIRANAQVDRKYVMPEYIAVRTGPDLPAIKQLGRKGSPRI